MNNHRRLRALARASTLSLLLVSGFASADTFDIVLPVPVPDQNVTVWSIASPNVKEPSTTYPQIQLRPGDTISVNAGGCVQTGGHGKTWKRYVDPEGANSDRLYHGLIGVPGVLPMQRIQAFGLGVPHTIPAGLPASATFPLQLGYEDDDYSDNGYWGHDDGTGNQCKKVGNAFVVVTIKHLPVQTGAVALKYAVLTVLYAPPGSGASSGAVSTATYGSSSTTGVSTSASTSFGSQYAVSASGGGVLFTLPWAATYGFGAATRSGVSTQIQLTKSTSNSVVVSGPAQDGIDHDLDEIWLWLNPVANVTVTGSNLTWSLSTGGSAPMQIQHVYAGCLRVPSRTDCASEVSTLARFGITAADYPAILARDPFGAGSTALDGNRFIEMSTTYPYEPPFAPGDAGTPQTYTMSTSELGSVTSTASDSYSVSTSAAVGLDLGIVGAALGKANTWTWTNTASLTTSQQSGQTISTTVGYPSAGYTGPTMLNIYYDTIYGSFLFGFDPTSTAQGREVSASLKGQITAGAAVPAVHQEVLLRLGGRTYRTFTNPRGRYYFPRGLQGVGQISVRGVVRPISIGSAQAVQDLRL
jgi:hypothetical protein